MTLAYSDGGGAPVTDDLTIGYVFLDRPNYVVTKQAPLAGPNARDGEPDDALRQDPEGIQLSGGNTFIYYRQMVGGVMKFKRVQIPQPPGP